MAEFQQKSTTEQVTAVSSLERLKRDLEGYREVLLPLNKVLEWEKTHYPAVLVGVITLLFAVIWYLEPSVLTTFSLLGVMLCLIDFVVPTLSSYLFSSTEWTGKQERQFEGICIRLLNAKTHLTNVRNALVILKRDKPKIYLLVMMTAFAALAWIGSLLDNLLLIYLLVIFLVLLPGLRRHGIIQRYTRQITEAVTKMVKSKTGKTKAN